MNPLIETERLGLREITLDDKEEMFQMYSNPDVHRYTGEPLVASMEEMEKAIQKRIKNYARYGYGRWAAFLKDNMQFIGWAGLVYLPEFDKVDLGYRFLPEYWGRGFATEASQAVVDYAFNVLNLEGIIAVAEPENKASIRVMEKVGMQYDKQAPYDEETPDAIWYKLSRTDYHQR